MKRKPLFISILLLLSAFVFFSCEVTPPTIIITGLNEGQSYFKDDEINVKIVIADSKTAVVSIKMYVDTTLYGELFNTPYHFTIAGNTVPPGKHKISFTMKNMGGESVSTFREFNVREEKSESDDFVSFAKGIIPPEWKVNEWAVSFMNGYDDLYSLFSAKYNADNFVTTHKRCNKVSFYLKGFGTAGFFMDNKLVELISLQSGDDPHHPEPQEWKLYEYSFPYKYCSFSWKLGPVNGYYAYLDAIHFYNQ